MRRRGGIKNDSNAREPGNDLLEQLQAFDASLRHHDGDAGDVATRPREAGRVTGGDRVRVAKEDDGDRRGRSSRRLRVDGTRYDDDIDLEPSEFLRQFAHPFRLPLRPPVLDGNVSTLHVAQVPKPLAKSFNGIRVHGRTVSEKNDAVDLPDLLRSRRERRRHRAAQQEHQLAASHSITSSGRASISRNPIGGFPSLASHEVTPLLRQHDMTRLAALASTHAQRPDIGIEIVNRHHCQLAIAAVVSSVPITNARKSVRQAFLSPRASSSDR